VDGLNNLLKALKEKEATSYLQLQEVSKAEAEAKIKADRLSTEYKEAEAELERAYIKKAIEVQQLRREKILNVDANGL
jgi:uncharacterized protein YecT (DUF1311 family)